MKSFYHRNLCLIRYVAYNVQEQDSEIENERDDIKDEAFFCPLLSEIELYKADSVFKIILDRL